MSAERSTPSVPWLQDADVTLYHGDVLSVLPELPAGSVDCVVTSPPYWGLRDYGQEGQLGLEPTPEQYVERMVSVFREVRRVLAPHGTVWLNLGDSYASGETGRVDAGKLTTHPETWTWEMEQAPRKDRRVAQATGLPQKNLVGIPWRVAFALQADGWYLRSDIIWAKPNPMPESVTDRPTKAHEYVFLLSKQPRYFFDQEAVREMYAPASEERYRYAFGGPKNEALNEANKTGIGVRTRPIGMREYKGPAGPDGRAKTTVQGADGSIQHRDGERWPNGGRNIRSVWRIEEDCWVEIPSTRVKSLHSGHPDAEGEEAQQAATAYASPAPSVWEIATQPYPEAHFATFPEELARRCIAAGCPEQVCRVCGKARERLSVVDEDAPPSPSEAHHRRYGDRPNATPRNPDRMDGGGMTQGGFGNPARKTLGFTDCGHSDYRPGIVLDPFIGSGTVAYVARKLGRHAVGIDLNESYLELAARRLQQQSLFAEQTA